MVFCEIAGYQYDAAGNLMAAYSREKNSTEDDLYLEEHPLYGSSRLGSDQNRLHLYEYETSVIDTNYTAIDSLSYIAGNKTFEYSNHLGNVLATTTDRKLPVDSSANDTVNYYLADVSSRQRFYPFGMVKPDSNNLNIGDYRFGFNGMESDNEISGNKSMYTTYFRPYSTKLGRWLLTDPVVHPWQSPYNAFDGNPIFYADPSGADGDPKNKSQTEVNDPNVGEGGGTTYSDDGNTRTNGNTTQTYNDDCGCYLNSPGGGGGSEGEVQTQPQDNTRVSDQNMTNSSSGEIRPGPNVWHYAGKGMAELDRIAEGIWTHDKSPQDHGGTKFTGSDAAQTFGGTNSKGPISGTKNLDPLLDVIGLHRLKGYGVNSQTRTNYVENFKRANTIATGVKKGTSAFKVASKETISRQVNAVKRQGTSSVRDTVSSEGTWVDTPDGRIRLVFKKTVKENGKVVRVYSDTL